jgi:hypothetical protein
VFVLDASQNENCSNFNKFQVLKQAMSEHGVGIYDSLELHKRVDGLDIAHLIFLVFDSIMHMNNGS